MAAPSHTKARVVTSALACLARTGLRGMTVDDVATDAGISRATLYRAFPGGRETILAAVVDAELDRLVGVVEQATATAGDLGEALTSGFVAAARWLIAHEALERLMFDEPATLLTHLEFEQADRTLAAVSTKMAPVLARFTGAELAERMGEWATRIVVSYLLFPSDEVELTEPEGVAWLVGRYVVPGATAAATEVREGETVST